MEDAKNKNVALKKAFDDADALKKKWEATEKKRLEDRETDAKKEYDDYKVKAVAAVKAQKTKHAALQKAEEDLYKNKDKAKWEALEKAVAKARDEFEEAERSGKEYGDKLAKMQVERDVIAKKERAAKQATVKEDFEKRKKEMDVLQKEWQEGESRKKKLEDELAGMDAKIGAAKGDDQVKLKMLKAKLAKEKGEIADIASMKGKFEAKKKAFDEKEAELAAKAKKDEDQERENAYAGVKTEYEDADAEFKKAGE